MKMTTLLFAALFFSVNHGCMENQKQMKLIVKKIEHDGKASLDDVSRLLEENTELHTIGLLNWDAFTYAPEVKFRIAHSNNEIWLKYYINEENILANHTEINSAVSRDSCVEFFFDPLGDGSYYNFEFSCIGTPHLAYGPGRHDRQFVDPNIINKHLKIKSTLGDQPFDEKKGGHKWEMTIVIPTELFTSNKGIDIAGIASKANFYKCGDDTSEKHYLTWNPVGTSKPDYHRPEYFGEVVFE